MPAVDRPDAARVLREVVIVAGPGAIGLMIGVLTGAWVAMAIGLVTSIGLLVLALRRFAARHD